MFFNLKYEGHVEINFLKTVFRDYNRNVIRVKGHND
jgi:hypothetical protein